MELVGELDIWLKPTSVASLTQFHRITLQDTPDDNALFVTSLEVGLLSGNTKHTQWCHKNTALCRFSVLLFFN